MKTDIVCSSKSKRYCKFLLLSSFLLVQSFSSLFSQTSTSLVRLVACFPDDPNSSDPLVIYYDQRATKFFDGQYDALKLYNSTASVPSFYSFSDEGTRLSINGLPYDVNESYIVKIGIKTGRSTNLKFKIKDLQGFYSSTKISLEDSEANCTTELTASSEYVVNLPVGQYDNRFSLIFQSLTTSIEVIDSRGKDFNIAYSRGVLRANIILPQEKEGQLTISDLSGRIIFCEKINSSGYYEFYPFLRSGIYISTFVSVNLRSSVKFMVID